MDDHNNNGGFIPIEDLPRYNINTNMSLRIFGVFIQVYVNRRGMSLSRREMQYEFVRYITFYDFPRSYRDIRDFVRAGFYYSQDRDFVVCYCCGYRRGNWMAADVPSDIHQRFSPNCIFFHANYTVDIPYHIFLERYRSFFPYFTRLNEQNRLGPSPVSERFSMGEEHLFGVHGVRPEINAEGETYETIPLANLPMRQDNFVTTSHLLSSLGVQVRRLDSISTLQESDNSTGMHMGPSVLRPTSVVLHSHLINRVDYTNNSRPSVMDYHDDYQRNLRNSSMNQDDGTFATTSFREQVEEGHDFTRDAEPVRQVPGTQINDSQENGTDDTERKVIHQPKTNRKSEFVINGRKENISLKLIPAQYLTKTTNDASSLQVELSHGCMHHSNISQLEDNVDVATMSSEVADSDLDSSKSICDTSNGQTSAVNGQLDISVSGGKGERSSSDLSVSTTPKSRELVNVSRENQHSQKSADKEMTSDHLCSGFEPHQNNTSPELSFLSQRSQPNSNYYLESHICSNAYQTGEEGAGDNITTSVDATGTDEDFTPDNWKIGHDEVICDTNIVKFKKQILGENDSTGKENVIIDPGGLKTQTKKNCTAVDPKLYKSQTPEPSVRNASDTLNVEPSYNIKECLSGMFIMHTGFEQNQNSTSPVLSIPSQNSQPNSNERLEGSYRSNAYQADEGGAEENISTIADVTNTKEDVTPDTQKMFDPNSVNNKTQIDDNDNAGNENVIIDQGYTQILTKKICATDGHGLNTSSTPESSSDTINVQPSCNLEECVSDNSPVIQDQSDEETHFQPPAERSRDETGTNGRTETGVSLENEGTDQIQHPILRMKADPENAHPNKKDHAREIMASSKDIQSSLKQESDDKVDILERDIQPYENVTQRNQCLYATGEQHQNNTSHSSGIQSRNVQQNSTENGKNSVCPNVHNINEEDPGEIKTENMDSYNDVIGTGEEQAGCHTIQCNSDQGSSHVHAPAKQEKDGTEILLETNTEDVRQTIPSVANESNQTNKTKEANNLETIVEQHHNNTSHSSEIQSRNVQQNSTENEENSACPNVHNTNEEDPGEIKTANVDSYNDVTGTGEEQAGCHTIQCNSDQGSSHVHAPVEQEKDETEILLETNTEDVRQTIPSVANESNQTNKTKEEEPKTETVTHHDTKEDDKTNSFINLGAVMLENDHLKRPADQNSHIIKEESCFQNAVEAKVQEKDMFQYVTNHCASQETRIGLKENKDGQKGPSDYISAKFKTDSSCGTPSCLDIQHQNSTSLPVKLGEEKVSTEYLRKCRSCNDVDKETENSHTITGISVSQDNANKVDDTLLTIRPIIAQENGTQTYQETYKADQHSALANEDISVSQGRNGTEGNKSHITQNASEFNVDMRSHNEASIQSETGQAAETKMGENAAYIALKTPEELRHDRSINEDREVPATSRIKRNSSTDMIACMTPKTNRKTKTFFRVDAWPNDTSRGSKEKVESRKPELTDNDELFFAKGIAREIEKINDPETRNDVKMQCFKIIFEAQRQKQSFIKKRNEYRSSPTRTLNNMLSATEEE